MRVLALTNLYPNPFQPQRAPFNRQQLRALAVDHAVRVIAPIAWTDELRARLSGASRIRTSRRVVTDGITVDHPRYLFPPKILRGSYGDFFRRCATDTFDRAVREFHPDIVLAAWAYPDGWAGVELARAAGLPVVIKVHGSDVLLLNDYPARRNRTIEALRNADGVVAVSRDLAGYVANLGVDPARVGVVYNGVDTTLFSPGPRDVARERLDVHRAERIVLYVGNLLAAKGVGLLVDACAELRRAGERMHCYFVGQGPHESALRRRIRRFGLADCVTLAGPRPLDQLPNWYRAADVLVLPSRSEGIPNVLLEAMSCGTPFVATNVGGIPEIAGGGRGRLVPPGDSAALVQAIRQALADEPGVQHHMTPKPASWRESAQSLGSFLQRFVSAPADRRAA